MTWGRFMAGLGAVTLSGVAAAVALYLTPNGLGLLLATGSGFLGGRTARSIWRV